VKILGYWLLLGLLRFVSTLPYALVARTGSILGAVLYRLPSHRKRAVLVNLRLRLPMKTECEHKDLALAYFRHVVHSYLERGFHWFGSARTINRLVRVDSAIDRGSPDALPTIFMGFHFVGIEVGCMLYSSRLPVAALYARMSNARAYELARCQRGRFGADMIERSASARQAVRSLRAGISLMLAAGYGPRNSSFGVAPLFGVPACTFSSVWHPARLAGAGALPFVTEVVPGPRGYKLTIFEPLENYSTNDESLDAGTMNAFL